MLFNYKYVLIIYNLNVPTVYISLDGNIKMNLKLMRETLSMLVWINFLLCQGLMRLPK